MASKSKSRRRVFRASCILAALIVAGSSFAWFSSKDEVTNRLSASANYGVSIVEDFQPPKNFLPGQKVNKDVAVVNTGNVDAFVRTWIDGEMSLVKKLDWANSTDADDGSGATIKNFSTDLLKTADDQTKLTGVNLNWYKGTNYYKELSQIKSENPENATTSNGTAVETAIPQSGENAPARFSEVQSIQAGGVLVYHDYDGTTNPEQPTGAEYYYVLEQAATIEGYEYDNGAFSATKTTKTYPAGTYVCTAASIVATDSTITDKVKIPYNYYGNIDTSQFFPESEGLYLFRRNVKLNDTQNTVDDYEYTGYYFLKDANKYTTTATEKTDDKSDLDKRPRDTYNPVYLALCYDTSHAQRSDYVLPDTALETNKTNPSQDEVLPVTLRDVKLYTAKENILKSYTGSTESWTVEGNPQTVTPLGSTITPMNDSSNTYTHTVTIGAQQYIGMSDEGEFVAYTSGTNQIDTTDKKTVVKTTTANGFTWNYTTYSEAVPATYTLSGADTSIPEQDTSAHGGTTAYNWKTVSNSVTYWSDAQAGPYYAESDINFSTNELVGTPIGRVLAQTSPGSDANGGVLYATYGTAGTNDYIRINVQLANLDNAPATSGNAETWSVIENVTTPDNKWTFYYNNDVEEGASTTKLIDYVELDKTVKDEAFLAFDFDLNVFMESVQVVLDDTGNETCDPVVHPWANQSATETNTNRNYNSASGENTNNGAEIEYITWTADTSGDTL